MGQTIAELFVEEGTSVVRSAHGQEKLDVAVQAIKAKGLNAQGVLADASSLKDTKQVFETAPQEFVDGDSLVNNAGIGDMRCVRG